MKAITIHQPWATLIATGAKIFETRSWPTKYRGPIAIHASKKDPLPTIRSLPVKVQRSIFDCYYEKFNISAATLERMVTGHIIATAELVECYEVHIDHTGDAVLMKAGVPAEWIGMYSNEFQFGHYDFGRYAWKLSNVKMLPEPIPVKGQQGIWNVELCTYA